MNPRDLGNFPCGPSAMLSFGIILDYLAPLEGEEGWKKKICLRLHSVWSGGRRAASIKHLIDWGGKKKHTSKSTFRIELHHIVPLISRLGAFPPAPTSQCRQTGFHPPVAGPKWSARAVLFLRYWASVKRPGAPGGALPAYIWPTELMLRSALTRNVKKGKWWARGHHGSKVRH